MYLKYIIIPLIFGIVASGPPPKSDNSINSQQNSVSNLNGSIDDSNYQPTLIQKIIFTEPVSPQIINVTRTLKRIQQFKQIENKPIQTIKQAHQQQKPTQTLSKQSNNISISSNDTKKQDDKNQNKQILQKKQQKEIQKNQTIEKQTNHEKVINQISQINKQQNKEEKQEEVYNRHSDFIPGSRFKPSKEKLDNNKIKLSQQVFPNNWFGSVQPKQTQTSIQQHKQSQNLVRQTIKQETKISITSQELPKSKTSETSKAFKTPTPLRFKQDKQDTQSQVHLIPSNTQKQNGKGFGIYKNVILIICIIIVFIVLCARLVSCAFNNEQDSNTRIRSQDREILKMSQNDLLIKDSLQSTGNFIQINEDDDQD